jgi:hypothetical protein
MKVSKTNKQIIIINGPLLEQYPLIYRRFNNLLKKANCNTNSIMSGCEDAACNFVVHLDRSDIDFERLNKYSEDITDFLTMTKLRDIIMVFNLCTTNSKITKQLLDVVIQSTKTDNIWIGLPLNSSEWNSKLQTLAKVGFDNPAIASKTPADTELYFNFMTFWYDKPPFPGIGVQQVINKANKLKREAQTVKVQTIGTPIRGDIIEPIVQKQIQLPADCDLNSFILWDKKVGLMFDGELGGMKIDRLCLKGYQLCKFLSAGTYGSVYKSCDINANCNYAIKFQKFNANDSEDSSSEDSDTKAAITENRDDWRKEAEIVKRLSEKYDIGPKYIGHWTCGDNDEIGVIIAELWDRSMQDKFLPNYTLCLPRNLIDKLSNQIAILHDNENLVHADIFPKNVLVKIDKNGNITDATITDFGSLLTPDEWRKEDDKRRWLRTWYDYHYGLYSFVTEDYQKDKQITFDKVYDDPRLLDYDYIYYLLQHC